MATRKRKRRFARIAALTVTLMVALLLLTSIWILFLFIPTDSLVVAIDDGGIGFSVAKKPRREFSGFSFRMYHDNDPWRWLPEWGTDHAQISRSGYLPLWIPLLLCIVATIVIFRRTRMTPTGCGACGYDLTGNVSGVCPECGERVVNEDEICPIGDDKPRSRKPG